MHWEDLYKFLLNYHRNDHDPKISWPNSEIFSILLDILSYLILRLMKHSVCVFLWIVLLFPFAQAQVPQAFSYQAVARDNNGICIANQNISIRVSIRDTATNGTILYQEQHFAIPTNEQGLFSLTIGADSSLATGAGQTTKFNDLNWINTQHWLEVEMDPTGGAAFVLVGSQQLMSVPYALAAGNGKEISASTQNESLNTLGGTGEIRARIYSGSGVAEGIGSVVLYGPNGSLNHILGVSGVTSANKGAQTLRNENGDSRIAFSINSSDQGVKNFVAAHPEDPTKQIWYASLEGPEAAAYERGSNQLVKGEATVQFSDHYRLIANTSTMTVQLTPLSAESKGIAVVEMTENGFKVKELNQGTGSYDFHWRVECVRRGCEDFRVIRDKSEDFVPDEK